MTERLRVVFEQLMVREFLPRHFVFRHTQKRDQRAALRVAVARQIRTKRLGHARRPDSGRKRRRHGGHDLTGFKHPAPCLDRVAAGTAGDSLDRAADAQHAS